MSFFEFPRDRSYEGDLGFIIKRLEELTNAYNNFFDYNTIKFHDPISWTISDDYTANTIVYDSLSQTFYISKRAVPSGIDIANSDYWLFLTPFKTDTALNADSINPIANKPVTEKFSIVDANISELNARLTTAIGTWTQQATIFDGRISNNTNNLTQEINDRTASDELINARIDEIIDGASVDPSAELLDIRVEYDGETASSAGDAVREQAEKVIALIDEVKDATTAVAQDETPLTITMNDALLLKSDGTTMSYQVGWMVSDICDISAYEKLLVTASSGYSYMVYAFYDDNGTFISGLPAGGDIKIITGVTVDIPEDAKYIRVSSIPNNTSSVTGLNNIHLVNNASFNKWNGKKWVVIGDSLTAVNSATSKHYFDYISDVTKINVVNYGISGTGYANPGDSTNFYQRVASLPTDADIYTIFGSFNDYAYHIDHNIPIGTPTDTGTSTLCGYFNSTISAICTRIPLANLGIVSPCPWVSMNEYNGAGGGFGKDYSDALKAVCERWSIPFLNLYEDSGLRPWDSTFVSLAYTHDALQGVHPDETGHAILATKFEAFLDSMLLH